MEFLIPAASITVGIITLAGVIFTALIRKPPEVGDLLDRMKVIEDNNGSLGKELDVLRREDFRRFGIMSGGMDAMAQYIERLRQNWPSGQAIPAMLLSEEQAIDLARRLQNEEQK